MTDNTSETTDDRRPEQTNSQRDSTVDEATAGSSDESLSTTAPTTDETPNLVTDAGKPCKVIGNLSNSSGVGVYGENTASSGVTYGVEGVTQSSDATAAAVRARAPNGARGVHATASDQIGVWAESTNSFALSGNSKNNTGIDVGTEDGQYQGVFGHNFANSNTNNTGYGVRGETESTGSGSAGVYGEGKPSSGTIHGVKAITQSSEGTAAGVRADSPIHLRTAHSET